MCQVFEKSLRSVCNQVDQDFKVIVVCNELPIVEFHDDRVEYVKVDFDPPSNIKGPRTGLEAVRKDKGCKYVIALLAAKKYKPSYIMFFDADDFIYEGIAGYCNQRPGMNGWYVDRGYVYRNGSALYSDRSDFYKWCGTCNIINYSLFCIPEHLSISSTQDMIVDSIDEYFLLMILGAHPFTVGYFANLGTPLNPLPFSAAAYVRGTGENHSGLFMTGLPKLISKKMNKEFGMGLDQATTFKIRGILYEYPVEIYRIIRYKLIPFLLGQGRVKPPV